MADVASHGLALVPDALSRETCARARDALFQAAHNDRTRGNETHGFALDTDRNNQRVWNLLNRDPVFADIAEHPLALHAVKTVLGWPALLSNISANIAGPGASPGVLHADQVFVPEPWPTLPQGINVAWCLGDVTRTNGATEFVPGSHLLARGPLPEDQDTTTVPIEAPAGSAVIFESRTWHRAGANCSEKDLRPVVFPFYTTTVYRTQENWFLSLDPRVLRTASPTLKTLLAYHSEGFGLVFGESPEAYALETLPASPAHALPRACAADTG